MERLSSLLKNSKRKGFFTHPEAREYAIYWGFRIIRKMLLQEARRFFFFSREEPRSHVHVDCPDGEAKFWLDPTVELARTHGLSAFQLAEVKRTVEERKNDILDAWQKRFSG
jgi:hypothetical protein